MFAVSPSSVSGGTGTGGALQNDLQQVAGLVWPGCSGTSWMIKDATDWPSSFPDLNPVEYLRALFISASDAMKYTWMSRSSLIHWCRSGRRSPRTPSADSSGARGQSECIQAGRGHTHFWVTLWVAGIKFMQLGCACNFNLLVSF